MTIATDAEATDTAAAIPLTYEFSGDLAVVADAGGPEAESISALRAHLIAKHTQQARRGLALCACEQDDRADWLAANLAISFAQANVRTLLLDCDLRAPRMHRYIRPSQEVAGLHDLLLDSDMSVGTAIRSDVLPGLSVMYAGGAAANPQELIFSNRFARIVDTCLREYDITIAVPPPTKAFADARLIAKLLRYAAVVARKDTTYLGDLKALISELQMDGARVVGSIYNAF